MPDPKPQAQPKRLVDPPREQLLIQNAMKAARAGQGAAWLQSAEGQEFLASDSISPLRKKLAQADLLGQPPPEVTREDQLRNDAWVASRQASGRVAFESGGQEYTASGTPSREQDLVQMAQRAISMGQGKEFLNSPHGLEMLTSQRLTPEQKQSLTARLQAPPPQVAATAEANEAAVSSRQAIQRQGRNAAMRQEPGGVLFDSPEYTAEDDRELKAGLRPIAAAHPTPKDPSILDYIRNLEAVRTFRDFALGRR